MWRTNDLIPEADEEVGTVKETKQDQSGGINISRNEYAAINLLGALYITTSFMRVGSVNVVVDNEKKKTVRRRLGPLLNVSLIQFHLTGRVAN